MQKRSQLAAVTALVCRKSLFFQKCRFSIPTRMLCWLCDHNRREAKQTERSF